MWWGSVWIQVPLAPSPGLWSRAWDLLHHFPPARFPTRNPLSMPMPEGNLGLPHAARGARKPESLGLGQQPSNVVGTRGRYMGVHPCFSKPERLQPARSPPPFRGAGDTEAWRGSERPPPTPGAASGSRVG